MHHGCDVVHIEDHRHVIAEVVVIGRDIHLGLQRCQCYLDLLQLFQFGMDSTVVLPSSALEDGRLAVDSQ